MAQQLTPGMKLYGVRMLDSLVAQGAIRAEDEALTLTGEGESLLRGQGLDIGSLRARRRPLCRACLDWSERRTHLAGALGAALLSHFLERGHARRVEESRIIRFSPEGERRFLAMFPAAD